MASDQSIGLGGHTGVAQKQVRIRAWRLCDGYSICGQLKDVCMGVAGTGILGITPAARQIGNHSVCGRSTIAGIWMGVIAIFYTDTNLLQKLRPHGFYNLTNLLSVLSTTYLKGRYPFASSGA